MKLIQVITLLFSQTKLYIPYPDIVNFLLSHVEDDDQTILNCLGEITKEHVICKLPFVPEEEGYLLIQDKFSGDWSLLRLPSSQNLENYFIYGLDGDQHTIQPLSRGEITLHMMARVARERLYIDQPLDPQGPQSLVYENIFEKDLEISHKHVNITFLNCRDLKVRLRYFPVGGIKIVKCHQLQVLTEEVDLLTGLEDLKILPIYAFYSSNSEVVIANPNMDTFSEINGCWNFNIRRL